MLAIHLRNGAELLRAHASAEIGLVVLEDLWKRQAVHERAEEIGHLDGTYSHSGGARSTERHIFFSGQA